MMSIDSIIAQKDETIEDLRAQARVLTAQREALQSTIDAMSGQVFERRKHDKALQEFLAPLVIEAVNEAVLHGWTTALAREALEAFNVGETRFQHFCPECPEEFDLTTPEGEIAYANHATTCEQLRRKVVAQP